MTPQVKKVLLVSREGTRAIVQRRCGDVLVLIRHDRRARWHMADSTDASKLYKTGFIQAMALLSNGELKGNDDYQVLPKGLDLTEFDEALSRARLRVNP